VARKVVDAKAAEKRKKSIAIVGALLLAGLLAIQVPRTLKMLNGAPAPAPAAETAASPVPAAAAPAAVAPGTATPVAAAAVLADTDVAPAPEDGQLVSFGRFKSKDPFAQQVDDAAAGEADPDDEQPAPAGGSAPAAQAGGVASGDDAPSGPSGGPAPREAGVAPAAETPSEATISVNGAAEEVSAESDFPAADPTFTLVSIGKGSVKIAIAGGSYSTGAETVTLALGKSVTLMNTADGARYELELVALA
jgi:hypothetical protein